MYDVIKKAFGPLKGVAGAIIEDCQEQMERWVNRYLEHYSKENMVMEATPEATDDLPIRTT